MRYWEGTSGWGQHGLCVWQEGIPSMFCRRVSIQPCLLLCESRKRKKSAGTVATPWPWEWWPRLEWISVAKRERGTCSIKSCEASKCHRQVISLEKLKSILHFRGRNNRRPHFHCSQEVSRWMSRSLWETLVCSLLWPQNPKFGCLQSWLPLSNLFFERAAA